MRRAVLLVLVAVALAGCAGPDGAADGGPDADGAETVYSHDWFYGPGYSQGGGFPVFRDSFPVSDGQGLEVQVDWNIEEGLAAVNLTTPSGDHVNVTAPQPGATGNSNATLPAETGTWDVRIPTWPGPNGKFPEGRVTVQVVRGG